jgi:ABC-type multidrug transport system ATPase subunit
MRPPVDFSSLAFEEVSRHFGRRRALHRVSFSCESGQIVALLGANGAGKSTLLSVAATMLSPSSGRVLYGSRTARDAGDALRGRIGLLGHDLYLYPELTAAENLSFFARLYGIDRIEARVGAALLASGLADRADDPVSSFSRGMRQRLALERALLHAPRLLLLDEPFSGLDDAASAALRDRLLTARREGAMILLTSHDLESLEGLVDGAYVLTAGRLESLRGRSGTLRQRYREHAVS